MQLGFWTTQDFRFTHPSEYGLWFEYATIARGKSHRVKVFDHVPDDQAEMQYISTLRSDQHSPDAFKIAAPRGRSYQDVYTDLVKYLKTIYANQTCQDLTWWRVRFGDVRIEVRRRSGQFRYGVSGKGLTDIGPAYGAIPEDPQALFDMSMEALTEHPELLARDRISLGL